jgi:tetratricopeptide (TPR) repeat protein
MMRSRALGYLGRHDEAIAMAKGLVPKRGASPVAIANLAARLMQAEKYREAQNVLDQALLTHPEHPALLTRLAYIEIELGRAEAALGLAQRAVNQLGAGRGERIAGYAHANLGHALALLGRDREAVAAFERSSELGLDIEDRERLMADAKTRRLVEKAESNGATKKPAPPARDAAAGDAPPEAPAGDGGEVGAWEDDAQFGKDEDWTY